MEDSDYDFTKESDHDSEKDDNPPLGFGRGTQGYKGIPQRQSSHLPDENFRDSYVDSDSGSQMDDKRVSQSRTHEIRNLPFWKWIGSPAFPSNIRASTRWVKEKHMEAVEEQGRVKGELNKLLEKRDQLEQGIQALDAYMEETKEMRAKGYRNRIKKTDATDKAFLAALNEELELAQEGERDEIKKKITKLKYYTRDRERKRRKKVML